MSINTRVITVCSTNIVMHLKQYL